MSLNTRNLEKIVKGFSNHRRIQLLFLLAEKPGLSVFDVAEETRCDFRTIGEHLRRLVISGLVTKKNDGKSVRHKVSDLGNNVLKFLRTLE